MPFKGNAFDMYIFTVLGTILRIQQENARLNETKTVIKLPDFFESSSTFNCNINFKWCILFNGKRASEREIFQPIHHFLLYKA